MTDNGTSGKSLRRSASEDGLSRRRFVHLTVVGVGAAVIPVGCGPQGMDGPVGADRDPRTIFFTDDERLVLSQVVDFVLPPDDMPGAAAMGAVDFIEQLLTAFEFDPPRICASGPFSDRNPIPGPDGLPSKDRPVNSLHEFLPLSREAELAWKLHIYGSDSIGALYPNRGLLGPVTGLRDQYRQGIAEVLKLTRLSPSQVTVDAVADVWSRLSPGFRDVTVRQVVQSVASAPEYGGNRDLSGWRLIHHLGDVAPYGFTPYDTVAGKYIDRPGEPFSQKDLRPDPDPIDDETRQLLEIIVAAAGGRRFY